MRAADSGIHNLNWQGPRKDSRYANNERSEEAGGTEIY